VGFKLILLRMSGSDEIEMTHDLEKSGLQSSSASGDIPFEGSTNEFLYVPGNSAKKKVLAVFVIAFQIVMYGYFAYAISADIKEDQVPVVIKHSNCFDGDKAKPTITDQLGNFACGADQGSLKTGLLSGAAMSFLAPFVVPDIGQALSGFKKNGMSSFAGSVLILVESILCMVAGGFFAASGSRLGPLDAFLGCVGVVFIHDLDEKVREGLDKIPYRYYMVSFVAAWVLGIVSIIVGMSFN